jgi:hypothetical protein
MARITETAKGILSNNISVELQLKHSTVQAQDYGLVKLELPEGTEWALCENNHLTELKLPASVIAVSLDNGLMDYETTRVKHVEVYYK